MDQFIDLHLHTNHSDGTCSTGELLDLVRESRISAFAITDHDTLGGYFETRNLLKPGDPELVSGVELSIAINDDDIHLLAYLFDPNNATFTGALADFQKKRVERGRQIVAKLHGLGIDIPFEEVERTAGGSAIGRPHIADTMVTLKKVHSYQDAFDRYISKSSPAYVPKAVLSPDEAIRLVHQAGGVTVLAHPFIDDMARHLDMLLHFGLDGIEVYHSSHSSHDVDRLKRIAKRHDLAPTGGSDFHGREGRFGMVGSQAVPAECLSILKQRAQRVREKQ
jgi:predicted metal-dependent phosphoesterase TrpH